MKELKADHQAGKISDEKYKQLSRQYMLKLKNIDASSRIRTMQGRPNSSNQPRNYRPDRRAAELSRREDEKLVQKYVVNPRKPESKKPKSKRSNNGKYAIIAAIFLILAFTTGIGFGMFNFDFQSANTNSSIIVADSAFPFEINNYSNLNTNATTTASDYSFLNDAADDTATTTTDVADTSTDTSADGGNNNPSPSDGGGSSDSGGSDSGGDSGSGDSGGDSGGGDSGGDGGGSEA